MESARADSAEERADLAEAQGTAAGKEHLRQIQAVSRQHSADVAQLAQEGRRSAAQCEQLQQEKVSLHANHTARLSEVSEAMEQERTNHLAAQEAFKVRGVRGLKELKALHAAKEASMAAQIQVLEDAYAASMLLLNVAQAAGREFGCRATASDRQGALANRLGGLAPGILAREQVCLLDYQGGADLAVWAGPCGVGGDETV